MTLTFLFPTSSGVAQDEIKLCFDTCYTDSLSKTLGDLCMRFYYN